MSRLGARGGVMITRATYRPVGRVRMNDENKRREVVLQAAVNIAKDVGLFGLSWGKVSADCEVQTSVITARRMFGTLEELRRAICKRALEKGYSKLIDEGRRFGFLQ